MPDTGATGTTWPRQASTTKAKAANPEPYSATLAPFMVSTLYCPLCAGLLEGVDLERFRRERKPQAMRCYECGQGWEVIGMGGKVIVSQANSFSRPELKVVKP